MSAVFSPCRKYRYALWRKWDDRLDAKMVAFIGLNPSTADETQDDPTIRRCIGFAKAWGYGSLCMLNLFAFRATDPKEMLAADDPVGPDNDFTIQRMSLRVDCVAAWGTHGTHRGRDKAVRGMVENLHYLRLTKDGHPAHPLYLPATLTPQKWNARTEGGAA